MGGRAEGVKLEESNSSSAEGLGLLCPQPGAPQQGPHREGSPTPARPARRSRSAGVGADVPLGNAHLSGQTSPSVGWVTGRDKTRRPPGGRPVREGSQTRTRESLGPHETRRPKQAPAREQAQRRGGHLATTGAGGWGRTDAGGGTDRRGGDGQTRDGAPAV